MIQRLARQRGFTLTEVLIALFIFSIVLAGALQVFNFVQITSESNDKRINRLREVQLAFRQLEEDIRYIVPRDRRNYFGDRAPLLKSESQSSNNYIEFTRTGWRNPAKLKRSSLQHVKYQLNGDKIVRQYWLYVDSAREGQQLERDVLSKVEAFEMEFLTQDTWKKNWLVEGDERLAMPEAIKITIVLEDYGELYRLFPMPRYEVASGDGERGGDDGNSQNPNNGRQPPGADDRGRNKASQGSLR